MGREIFVDAATNRPGPPPLPSGKPVEGCWFCLSNPNADVELVASVGASKSEHEPARVKGADMYPRSTACAPATPMATKVLHLDTTVDFV